MYRGCHPEMVFVKAPSVSVVSVPCPLVYRLLAATATAAGTLNL